MRRFFCLAALGIFFASGSFAENPPAISTIDISTIDIDDVYGDIEDRTLALQTRYALAQTAAAELLLLLSISDEIRIDLSSFLPRIPIVPVLLESQRPCRDPLLLAQMRREADAKIQSFFSTFTIWEPSPMKRAVLRSGAGIIVLAVGYRFYVYEFLQRDPGVAPVTRFVVEGVGKPTAEQVRSLVTASAPGPTAP